MEDYNELRERAEGEFLIEGPNSGGVYGMLLVEGRVYWFEADWTPRVMEHSMSVDEFLDRYGDKDTRGYKELVQYLRGES